MRNTYLVGLALSGWVVAGVSLSGLAYGHYTQSKRVQDLETLSQVWAIGDKRLDDQINVLRTAHLHLVEAVKIEGQLAAAREMKDRAQRTAAPAR